MGGGALFIDAQDIQTKWNKPNEYPREYWMFIGGICLYIIGNVFDQKRRATCGSLQKQIATLTNQLCDCSQRCEDYGADYYDLFDEELRQLYVTLNFGDSERVSVYKHDGKNFRILGRFSKDPEFNKQHRKVFPDSQGAIEKAWRQGDVLIENLPDPTTTKGNREYISHLTKNWGIPRAVCNQLTMKSRSYYAIAIDDSKGSRIAVLVCESTYPNGLSTRNIEIELNNERLGHIAAHIEKHRDTEPTPSYAEKEGF